MRHIKNIRPIDIKNKITEWQDTLAKYEARGVYGNLQLGCRCQIPSYRRNHEKVKRIAREVIATLDIQYVDKLEEEVFGGEFLKDEYDGWVCDRIFAMHDIYGDFFNKVIHSAAAYEMLICNWGFYFTDDMVFLLRDYDMYIQEINSANTLLQSSTPWVIYSKICHRIISIQDVFRLLTSHAEEPEEGFSSWLNTGIMEIIGGEMQKM